MPQSKCKINSVKTCSPCSYRVIETRVKVWENEKCDGNTSRRRAFPQLFRVLPNFHESFYNSIGTRRTCFLFLLENTATKKKKNNLFTYLRVKVWENEKCGGSTRAAGECFHSFFEFSQTCVSI